MSGWLVLIVLCVFAFGVFYFFRQKKTKVEKVVETAQNLASEILKQKEPEKNVGQMRADLLGMNVQVRTQPGFTQGMLDNFERLLDKLDDIIPKMSSKWPDSDLTWETSRIATKHLPNFLAKFLVLEPEQLFKKEAQFLESLKTIEIEVDEVIALFATNAENEASTRARIIERKFEQAPSESI